MDVRVTESSGEPDERRVSSTLGVKDDGLRIPSSDEATFRCKSGLQAGIRSADTRTFSCFEAVLALKPLVSFPTFAFD
jgi:hypothetical protein